MFKEVTLEAGWAHFSFPDGQTVFIDTLYVQKAIDKWIEENAELVCDMSKATDQFRPKAHNL